MAIWRGNRCSNPNCSGTRTGPKGIPYEVKHEPEDEDEAVLWKDAVYIKLLSLVSNLAESTSNRSPSSCAINFINELSAVCRKNFNRRIDQVTNKVLKEPLDQTRTGHQVSTPYYPFSALAPPSFPSSRPGTSILIDCRS